MVEQGKLKDMMFRQVLQVVVYFQQRNHLGRYKEKHTKIGSSENQRNNDKKPGKCNHCIKTGALEAMPHFLKKNIKKEIRTN